MMRDIVDEAIENTQDEAEREATGVIDGHDVTLKKETYQMEQRGPTSWRVAVYIGGEVVPSEKEQKMSADGAEALYQELRERHDLQ